MIGILGNGLLGKVLHKQTGWEVIDRSRGFDIRNLKTFWQLMESEAAVKECRFRTIVNCVAATNTYSGDKQVMIDTNYKGVVNLVEFCNKLRVKLVHISTAYVYANSKPRASEDNVPVHAENWYSYSKLLADAYIEAFSNNYLICRVLHKNYPNYEKAWIDQVGNYMTPEELAVALEYLIEKRCQGIYNVGGDQKTAYDWSSQYRDVLPITKPDNAPADISMNLSKYREVCPQS